uniref:Ovule protein n=1 Tax=Loa loa TaxID=7209 RepID=A0A1I7VKE1_LOALO
MESFSTRLEAHASVVDASRMVISSGRDRSLHIGTTFCDLKFSRMDIDNHSLINQSSSNTENGRKEISFGENRKGSEPSSSSVSTNTSQTFMEEERENAIDDVSEANLHLTEHQSRSQTRNNKLSDPLCVHNCNDRLPPLETEQQFRTAVTRCARGGDSMERNSSHVDTGVARDVPNISPLMLKTKPVIISSSPVMKTSSSTKAKGVEGRRTATEVDAFFTRLSTPKCIKGKVSKEKKIGDRVQQVSVAQRRRYEATKGLSVNVVRTRSNSAVRSGSHCSGVGK